MLLAGCGSSSSVSRSAPTSYILTVNSTSPASGATIAVTPADNNKAADGTTVFTRSYTAGSSVTLTAAATSGTDFFQSWTGCTQATTNTCAVTMNADTAVTANYATSLKVTPTVTVTPSPAIVSVINGLTVTVALSSTPTPTGTVKLTSGSYASAAVALTNGSASFNLAAGSLPQGSDTLTGAYTPDAASASTYNGNTGTAWVTVTAPAYTLTIDSTSPASGVPIAVAPADNSNSTGGTTSFTRSYYGGTAVTLTAPATAAGNPFVSWSGCASTSALFCTVTMNANTTVTANYLPPITYTLTVNSATPSSGVAIGVSPADNNNAAGGTTTLTRNYNAGTSVTLTAPATSGNYSFVSWSGCASAGTVTCTVAINADTAVTATYAPTVCTLTVNSTNPASGVAIGATPADNLSATGGTTSFTLSYNAGTTATLTAPSASGTVAFRSWSGCTSATAITCTVAIGGNLTVSANYGKFTPTVTVTPSASSITTLADLTVPVTVTGDSGDPTPTGSVIVTSGSYTSAATTLSNGSVSIDIPAGSLATGSDTLTATYTPDAASSTIYLSATGTSSAVTVVEASSVTVDLSSAGAAVSSHLLGMNMAAWVDPTLSAILPALQTAGITAIRWPGGSWANDYHWATNKLCSGGTPNTNASFENLISGLVTPGNFDVALAVNYSTNATCDGPGEPDEAAAWAAKALDIGAHVSHITVGNENYGNWEPDLHPKQWDAATYAAATATTKGYYQKIKAADPNVQVGVSVNAGDTSGNTTAGWDSIVLADAEYDFVEYHFYAQAPGQEKDTYLVQQAAQALTAKIETIKTELAAADKPKNTPIFIGEIGSVYDKPGVQSSSITQALYAGQVLGEMMNEGISYATWWLGFGGCTDKNGGNFSSLLYGLQDFGGYMVFSDGTPTSGCENATTVEAGTLLPTARAYQLFSNVAVDGEKVLTAKVAGDTTDVRAYAATHSGGTALVLFNLNETLSKTAVVTLSGQSTTAGGTITTYSKDIYDQSETNVWAAPTTTTISSQSLPLMLTLDPWSMNVVLLQ